MLNFGPYRLDLEKEQLWCDNQPVRLPPKAFQVLCYVVTRPGQLVTKEGLFHAVWTDTVVGDAALSVCIQELRKVLQDNAKTPQYLETVPRRGFRFIAAVVKSEEVVSSQPPFVSSQEQSANAHDHSSVMPVLRPSSGQAPAGIQELQAQASGDSPWIPASAGMIPLEAPPQSHILSPQPEQSRIAAALPTPRAWSRWQLVVMGLVLLVSIILIVQYLSLSFPSPLPLTPSPQSTLPLPDKPSLIVLPFL